MKRNRFAYLLVLLLMSASVDDVWWAVPAENPVETPAAADNDYLPPSSSLRLMRRDECDLPPFGRWDGWVASLSGALPPPAAIATRPCALFSAPLLYLLMSLQR